MTLPQTSDSLNQTSRSSMACRRAGVAPPVVCQPYYNAMNRQPEVEVLPACRA